MNRAHRTDSVPPRAGTRPDVLLEAEVVAHALRRLGREELAGFRRRPGAACSDRPPISPSLLRYSDEQTVAGLAAVLAAMPAAGGGEIALFERWGVVAASRFLGRAGLAVALRQFGEEGVWGVSPHLIPHFALHSPAGTLSLALGLHGPNLGIGGGRFAASEGLLTALTWLAAGVVPGVWLVATGWSPEYVPDETGQPRGNPECQALALALAPAGRSGGRAARVLLVEHAAPVEPSPVEPCSLVRVLERVAERLPAGSARDSRGLVIHSSHGTAALRGPHFDRVTRDESHGWTIASDAAGRFGFQLLPQSPVPGDDR